MVQTLAISRDMWGRHRGWALCWAGGIHPRFVHISRAGLADSQAQKAPAWLVTLTRGFFNQRGSTPTYLCLSRTFHFLLHSSALPKAWSYFPYFPQLSSSSPCDASLLRLPSSRSIGRLQAEDGASALLKDPQIMPHTFRPVDATHTDCLTYMSQILPLRHQICFHNITCSLLLGSIKPGPNKNLYLKLKNFP